MADVSHDKLSDIRTVQSEQSDSCPAETNNGESATNFSMISAESLEARHPEENRDFVWCGVLPPEVELTRYTYVTLRPSKNLRKSEVWRAFVETCIQTWGSLLFAQKECLTEHWISACSLPIRKLERIEGGVEFKDKKAAVQIRFDVSGRYHPDYFLRGPAPYHIQVRWIGARGRVPASQICVAFRRAASAWMSVSNDELSLTRLGRLVD
jgi:hypothetical protein